MNNSGLGQWILDLVNSNVFSDWLCTSIFGLAWWLAGRADIRKQYPLFLPEGLRRLFSKKRHYEVVYLRSFVMQVMGIVLWLWSLEPV